MICNPSFNKKWVYSIKQTLIFGGYYIVLNKWNELNEKKGEKEKKHLIHQDLEKR